MTLTEAGLEISPAVYEWTGRTISLLEKVLRVHIKLHDQPHELEEGDIFLFNHFARFETFIPQYLIYRETGAYCRSVASAEFFREDDTLSRYLLSLGAVPTDYPGLLGFLAAEVLRGRKVVVFPEGGMVKDRRVLDRAGHYSIYSRIAKERRKHHTGAALVALAVHGFKQAVRDAAEAGQEDRLRQWGEDLGLAREALLAVARRPTRVVPANITFYPIRISSNLLRRGAEFFYRGLSPRLAEELLIEGNILLTPTDMDIRLGKPAETAEFLTWWDRRLLTRVARRVNSIGEFLGVVEGDGGWDRRLLRHRLRRDVLRMRDHYMVGMYAGVTVNLSHLASQLILHRLDRDVTRTEVGRFHRTLYLAVKGLQGEAGVHLHRSLRNPDAYAGLLGDDCPGLGQFVETATRSKLVERTDGTYHFLPKLRREYALDEIRTENLVAVYANEVQPIAAVTRQVAAAAAQEPHLDPVRWARLRFDDEVLGHRWDREAFHRPRHEQVNREETATLSGAPFLLEPETGARALGVLLVHGFSASPAEVRPFGERLLRAGYRTLGVRLKGHGTSPWDLLERRWTDWLASLRTGFEILASLTDRVAVVGFSGGAALALRFAGEAPADLAGVVSVSSPVRLREKAMSLVPLVHGANRLWESLSPAKGIMLFHTAEPEHPQVNYRRMPIRALYELGLLIEAMRERLPEVRCPALLLQGTEDPTVDPSSVETIYAELGSEDKATVMVPADRHGILYEDLGGTQSRILQFLDRLEAGNEPQAAPA